MLNISKVFTFLCLLCLCGNREYLDSSQNKLVSSSFRCLSEYIMFLAKLKREEKAFQSEKAYTYPLNSFLRVGVMLAIIKVFIILLLLVGIGNILVIFKTNQ